MFQLQQIADLEQVIFRRCKVSKPTTWPVSKTKFNRFQFCFPIGNVITNFYIFISHYPTIQFSYMNCWNWHAQQSVDTKEKISDKESSIFFFGTNGLVITRLNGTVRSIVKMHYAVWVWNPRRTLEHFYFHVVETPKIVYQWENMVSQNPISC